MEHEIIGHSKKALKVWKTPGKQLGEKVKEILIEILIIVFAVTFAALIERTREHYKEKAEAKEFLIGLKGDIKNEIIQFEISKKNMVIMRTTYFKLLAVNVSQTDSLKKAKIKMNFFIPKFDTRPLNGRYDGFKASGKIQTIENDSLRNDILKFYEEQLPSLSFAESVFNSNQTRLEDMIFANADIAGNKPLNVVKMLASTKGKTILQFSSGYSDGILTWYEKVLKQAHKIEKEIDKEYK